jgi:hypothetical protein
VHQNVERTVKFFDHGLCIRHDGSFLAGC